MNVKTYDIEKLYSLIAIPNSERHEIERDMLRDQHVSRFVTQIAMHTKEIVEHRYSLTKEIKPPSFLDWLFRRKKRFILKALQK